MYESISFITAFTCSTKEKKILGIIYIAISNARIGSFLKQCC